jgi:hypothetical protein
MEPRDGNTIAGLLYEIFGVEMTDARAVCATCGNAAAVADGVVHSHLSGHVVRCRT